jgi:hypothetical protein
MGNQKQLAQTGKEFQFRNEYAANAANIQLGENTKALIICLAQLWDISANVERILGRIFFEREADSISMKFIDAKLNLDSELVGIISLVIDSEVLNSSFKKM